MKYHFDSIHPNGWHWKIFLYGHPATRLGYCQHCMQTKRFRSRIGSSLVTREVSVRGGVYTVYIKTF